MPNKRWQKANEHRNTLRNIIMIKYNQSLVDIISKRYIKIDSWIYNYLLWQCNQCLSLQKMWVRTPFMARCTRYNTMWSSLSVTLDRSVVLSGYPVSSTNKTDSPQYNWNIVENGVKHHKPIPPLLWRLFCAESTIITASWMEAG